MAKTVKKAKPRAKAKTTKAKTATRSTAKRSGAARRVAKALNARLDP